MSTKNPCRYPWSHKWIDTFIVSHTVEVEGGFVKTATVNKVRLCTKCDKFQGEIYTGASRCWDDVDKDGEFSYYYNKLTTNRKILANDETREK